MTPESRSQSRVGLGLRQTRRQPGLPALTHWQPESQPRSWTARSLFRVPGPLAGVAASHWQSLALAVTGPGDSPAPAESPTRRLDSFQFPSFQVRSLSLSSLKQVELEGGACQERSSFKLMHGKRWCSVRLTRSPSQCSLQVEDQNSRRPGPSHSAPQCSSPVLTWSEKQWPRVTVYPSLI